MSDVEFFPLATSLGSIKPPFSEAVRVGNVLYLSGAIGTDANGSIVPGGIEPETRQALANVAAVLERHGSAMDRLFKVTVMLADMAEWAAMNKVYLEHVGPHLPVRSAFGASGLALGARVEIECVATVRD
jgi:2-iminobutanoate/2-iminopropanoate deaminase